MEGGHGSRCISTRDSRSSSGGLPRRTCPGFKHISEQLSFHSEMSARLQLIYAVVQVVTIKECCHVFQPGRSARTEIARTTVYVAVMGDVHA